MAPLKPPYSFLVNDESEKLEESRRNFEESYLQSQDLPLLQKYHRLLLRMRSLQMGAFLALVTSEDYMEELAEAKKEIQRLKSAVVQESIADRVKRRRCGEKTL